MTVSASICVENNTSKWLHHRSSHITLLSHISKLKPSLEVWVTWVPSFITTWTSVQYFRKISRAPFSSHWLLLFSSRLDKWFVGFLSQIFCCWLYWSNIGVTIMLLAIITVSVNGRHCIQSYLTEKQKELGNLSM